jgi:glyceraldehyde-3-phosphate dehydrogenase (NADP+)
MRMLLADTWVDRDHHIEVRDPYDGSVVDTVPAASAADIETALDAAVRGCEVAKKMTSYERATVLRNTADYVERNSEDFATTIAREGSKTIREARKEVSRCVNVLNVSADASKQLVGETIRFDSFPGGENRVGYYERVPVGVVAAITPFNDPLNLVAHKLGPAVAAGNAVVLKPATSTPLSALKLVEAFMNHGLPPLVVQAITGEARDMGDQLIADERVRMISFTGGVETGKMITRKAGLKKLGMELGSNSPVIVWKDADVAWAAETCVSGAFWAAGQNCIGVQRLYVHEDVYGEFRDRFASLAARYKLGSKLDESTDMGPLIDEAAAERVERRIHQAVDMGATVITGGKRSGTSIPPTVLEKVPTEAELHHQEVFGPTVNLYPVRDLDDAIAQANSLPFGVHAGLFTRDVETAFYASRHLDCGGVMINDSTDYRLDAMPFGGVKDSGLGREGVRFSLQEMTEPKVVCFHLAGR